jgi:hypothetical protein
VYVPGNAVVTPQTTHHFRENGLQHLLTMALDPPRVVHVVAFFSESLLHVNVLI